MQKIIKIESSNLTEKLRAFRVSKAEKTAFEAKCIIAGIPVTKALRQLVRSVNKDEIKLEDEK